MDMFSLTARAALRDQGSVFSPYTFSENISEADRATIEDVFKRYLEAKVDSMFNSWHVWYVAPDCYCAKRATWDMGIFFATTAQALADQIGEYYRR